MLTGMILAKYGLIINVTDYMHNGDKHVHMENSGRNILGHGTHSSIGKCIVNDMAFGVVGQPGWKCGLR